MISSFKLIIMVMCLISISYSCSNPPKTPKNMVKGIITKNYTTPIKDSVSSNTFIIFWQNFRMSIINHDTIQFNKSILRPFEVSGFEDDEPKYFIWDNDSILAIFNTFTKDSTAYCDSVIDHLTLIQKSINIKKLSNCDFQLDSNYCRIGQMIFSKQKNHWFFSGIYLKTRNRTFW